MSTWIEQHNNIIPSINTYMHSKTEREREREREIEYNPWTQVCSTERYCNTKPIQSSYLHSTQYYAPSEITHVRSFRREWSTTSKYPLHKALETTITSIHTHVYIVHDNWMTTVGSPLDNVHPFQCTYFEGNIECTSWTLTCTILICKCFQTLEL